MIKLLWMKEKGWQVTEWNVRSLQICGKKFTKRYSLNVHTKQAHTGEEPAFPCDQCERRFHQRDELKRHLLKHANIRRSALFLCVLLGSLLPMSY